MADDYYYSQIERAYLDFDGVFITDLDAPEIEDDELELKHDNPDISVDTSARFNNHDVIAGKSIRQKLGEDPREFDVSGACTTEEAKVIDKLMFEDTLTFTSNRTGTVKVQVASTSTSPNTSGGELSIDGDFTHSFSMTLVEVE